MTRSQSVARWHGGVVMWSWTGASCRCKSIEGLADGLPATALIKLAFRGSFVSAASLLPPPPSYLFSVS